MRLLPPVVALLAAAACARAPQPARPLPPLPRDAYAHYLRGQVAVVEGDHQVAVRELALAARASPDEPLIAVALAEAQGRAGQPKDAATTIAAAQRRWPADARVWQLAGELAQARRDGEQARAAFERAIQLDPRDERPYLALARSWLAAKQDARAEATWRRLLARVPASIEGHFRAAQAALGRGDRSEAEAHLREVIQLDADHLDARITLAGTLRADGKLALAIEQTRQAFDRSGQDDAMAEELFWLLCEADDRQGALDLLGLVDDDYAAPSTRLLLSRLYLGLGEIARAEGVVEPLASAAFDVDASAAGEAPTATEIAHAMIAVARARRSAHDFEGAIAALAALPAATEPGQIAAALIAEIHLDAGKFAAALAVLAPALAAAPDDPSLVFTAALARHGQGDDSGVASLEALLRRRPDDREASLAVAAFAERLGQRDRALVLLRAEIVRRPDAVAALNLAGYLLADADRDLPEAERNLARARYLAPGDPTILDSWGWLRFRQGHLAEATRALDLAARLAPLEAEIAFHLGQVWLAAGRRTEARTALDRALHHARPGELRTEIEATLAALRRHK